MLKTRRNALPGSALILIVLVKLCLFALGVNADELRGPELLLPLGHIDGVYCVSRSADGERILTGSRDCSAILWDAATAKPLRALKGHTDLLSSGALSADAKRALTGSWDWTSILWNTETAAPIQTFRGHLGQVSSVALGVDCERVLTGSWDHTAILWDTKTAKPLQTFKGHTGPVNSVSLSEDGKRVLTGSDDRTAILWDAETAEPIRTFRGHFDFVRAVALSADCTRILTGSDDHSAVLWDAETAEPIRTFRRHARHIICVALSRDGKRVFTGSGDRSAILWDADTGKPSQTLTGHSDAVTSLALFEGGNSVLTASSDSFAILWDAATANRRSLFARYASAVPSMALSSNGKLLVTGSFDQSAILWNIELGRPIRMLRGRGRSVEHVALSDDGKRVLTRSGSNLTVWDSDNEKPIWSYKSTDELYSGFRSALSGDGKVVFTQAGREAAMLWDPETAKPIQKFHGLVYGGETVALSRNGRRVLIGSFDTALMLDAESAEPIRSFKGHAGTVLAVALSSDYRRVLTGSVDKSAIMWDAASAKRLQTFKGHTGPVNSVALSEDGKRALTGSKDGQAILWDTDTAKQLQTFKGHNGPVTGVAIAPANLFMVSSSLDGTVRIWKPGREAPVFSFLSSGEEWLFWTPEGYYASSPNGETLISWKVRDDSPRGYQIVGPDQLRKKFHRPDIFQYLFRELDLTRALAIANRESRRPVEAPSTVALSQPPNVAIIRPERDAEIGGEKLTVEALSFSVGDHPVTRMRLLLDGRPYHGNMADFEVPQPKLGKVHWSKEIELEPGEHTLQVIAESVSEGRSDVIRIRRKSIVEAMPRLFVLAIGVSAYEKKELRKDVYYASADALTFADTIQRWSKPLYHDGTVVRLIDKDASKRNILRQLSRLKTQSTQHDAVMIYFAGHGKRDDQNNFYFLPVDVDLDELPFTGLSEGEFKPLVKAITGRVILYLDACHSGTLIENPGRGADGLTDRLYLDLTSNEFGLVMMCSSRGLEKSLESPEHKSGYFTMALVEGLGGKARKSNDGAVYFRELDAYVTERVKILTFGKQHPLTSQATTITNIPLTKP